ncbi:group I truncated hemoglobin [Thermoflavimicrobium daqui]|uniref:group I truncated hemoglobin n=1 Tax=Thermoflavimicrobium daqui TaxID=2137476 RepID=UPI001F0C3A7D|nr:group 1 truncated hemoglobin [Thermoflavimicrobium daqui]
MATIYEQLGGEVGIAQAVDIFYELVLEDERINYLFEKTDMAKLKRHQAAFLTFATGGPNKYTGQSMQAAHKGLHITQEQFQVVASHLASTLKVLHVQDHLIEQVIQTVAQLEKDIVSR